VNSDISESNSLMDQRQSKMGSVVSKKKNKGNTYLKKPFNVLSIDEINKNKRDES
jgi:hypothetical protein